MEVEFSEIDSLVDNSDEEDTELCTCHHVSVLEMDCGRVGERKKVGDGERGSIERKRGIFSTLLGMNLFKFYK
uniref:Uncharacterized protein n=1 Tax=Solanum lycopersicum TaxID=4081 RepID=A0A3Q7H0F3_SOLLC